MTSERLSVFYKFVCMLSSLSKCSDKKQAAIIVDKELSQVYSIGLNGGPKHGTDCLCKLGGKYTCIHAETQALAKAHCDTTGMTMICTMSPCVTCAAQIINCGIKHVIYVDAYKDDTGIKMLEEAGVEVDVMFKLIMKLKSTHSKYT